MTTHKKPQGNIAYKLLVTPSDLNHHQTIFGGALLAYFDLAASIYTMEQIGHKVMLVGVKNAAFLKPAYVNECLTFYVTQHRIGNTSITINLEAWCHMPSEVHNREPRLVSTAELTMVAVTPELKPTAITQNN